MLAYFSSFLLAALSISASAQEISVFAQDGNVKDNIASEIYHSHLNNTSSFYSEGPDNFKRQFSEWNGHIDEYGFKSSVDRSVRWHEPTHQLGIEIGKALNNYSLQFDSSNKVEATSQSSKVAVIDRYFFLNWLSVELTAEMSMGEEISLGQDSDRRLKLGDGSKYRLVTDYKRASETTMLGLGLERIKFQNFTRRQDVDFESTNIQNAVDAADYTFTYLVARLRQYWGKARRLSHLELGGGLSLSGKGGVITDLKGLQIYAAYEQPLWFSPDFSLHATGTYHKVEGGTNFDYYQVSLNLRYLITY